MKKQFVLKNTANGKYWTGDFYDSVLFSANIEDARRFYSEPEIEEVYSQSPEIHGTEFELVTLYSPF